MIIQLRGLCIHYMLRCLHSVRPMQLWFTLICLLFRMLVNEQVFDLTRTRSALIDCEGRCEFSVGANLDGVKHADGKILAVV